MRPARGGKKDGIRVCLRVVVLALLSKQSNSGYGISRLLRGELSHLWAAHMQQIYAELARAERLRLVDVERIEMPNRPAKKMYTLTEAGLGALEGWLIERPEGHTQRDELLVKLYCLERLPDGVAVRHLEERLRLYEEEIVRLRGRLAQLPRTDPQGLGERITLEAAVARAEAEVGWTARATELLRGADEGTEGQTESMRQQAG